MSTQPPEIPVANRYTPDAQERVGRLRQMAAEFPDDADPRPMTIHEVRVARRTSVAALEKAAVFAEAAPVVGGVTDTAALRDAIAFELAYGGVRDEAAALARYIDHAILRRKFKAVRATRGLYRVAKGFVTLDAGDSARPHVEELKRTLVRPRRKKAEKVPADPDVLKKK